MPRRDQNQFQPHFEQIRELAEKGYNTRQILEELGMEVTKSRKEQLRRFLHSRNLPIAKPGAQMGELHRDWKGGRTVDKHGYILIYKPDHPKARKIGYILEHRYVMEQHIGRYLEDDEVVHHINGNTSDNRIENLELFDTNADHLRETLAGQVPDWTEEGWENILKGTHKAARNRTLRANSSKDEAPEDDDKPESPEE